MSPFQPAADIDEVLARLDALIVAAAAAKNRLGYFPALYRRVTQRVKEGIAAGRFEDGPRMGRLDVCFANRYLEAEQAWREGRPCSGCWRVAFEATRRWRPLAIQHLLLGMNAHINLDLGIAAAQEGGGQLAALQVDFDRINTVLSELVASVEDDLSRISPFMRCLEFIGGRSEDAIVEFSMDKARDAAWSMAQRLAAQPEDARPGVIAEVDGCMAGLGRFVADPGPFLRWGLLFIRLGELRNPRKVIAALRN